DPGVENFLRSIALSHPDDKLAQAAMYALADHLEDGGIESLMEILKKAKSPKVKKAALYKIGEFDGGPVIEALGQVLKSETDPELRKAAVYALGETESDQAVP
ncbi:MAG: HEAT repeat domain-containing protein, partial [Calditrichaeota bacterium]|nr:HEAT repeat domain-containing protein [Calditrichota bacterium]